MEFEGVLESKDVEEFNVEVRQYLAIDRDTFVFVAQPNRYRRSLQKSYLLYPS